MPTFSRWLTLVVVQIRNLNYENRYFSNKIMVFDSTTLIFKNCLYFRFVTWKISKQNLTQLFFAESAWLLEHFLRWRQQYFPTRQALGMHWSWGQNVKGQGHRVNKCKLWLYSVYCESVADPVWVCMSIRLHNFVVIRPSVSLAICRPSGCTVASGVVGVVVVVVVVCVCNRSVMRTSKCTCLIFGLDPSK